MKTIAFSWSKFNLFLFILLNLYFYFKQINILKLLKITIIFKSLFFLLGLLDISSNYINYIYFIIYISIFYGVYKSIKLNSKNNIKNLIFNIILKFIYIYLF